jgi:all-trans-retinol 13,14-reductase
MLMLWLVHGCVLGIYAHFLDGGYYPVGGPQAISKALIPVIEATGGRVLVRAPVDRIVVENGRAVGVKVKGNTIRAPAVVSAVGAWQTFFSLLPKEVGAACMQLWLYPLQ